MSDPGARVPRAVILPLPALAALTGVGSELGASAVAVSLDDPGPTHLLIVAERLSSSFAASAALAGGRILYGRPDSRSFAEATEEFPPPWEQGYTLRLRGHAQPFSVRGMPEPLERFMDVRWSPDAAVSTRPQIPAAPIRLRRESTPRPVLGVIVPKRDRRGIEDVLHALPEARLAGVAFAVGEEEMVLVGDLPGPLEGVPGEAFHLHRLTDGRSLYLPLGVAPEPEFALAWLATLLGKEGDRFFWRDGAILSLKNTDLTPLTRRAWYEAFRDGA